MSKYPTDPVEAAERVQAIAKLLRLEAERIVALKQFFDSGNSKAAADALGLFEEGTVVTLLRGAATEAMVMACAKAWDGARPDRHTIPSAAVLLSMPGALDLVAARGNRRALDDFGRLVDEMDPDYARARLRDFRNYRLAHHLPDELATVDPAKLLHLWNMIDDTLRTIYQLGLGTGITSVSFDSVASVWDGRCASFWRRLIDGPQGRQVVKQ